MSGISQAQFDPYDMNLDRIIAIESAGNPRAYNKKSKATGLTQITPIALKDWNQMNPRDQYSQEQLYDPQINQKIGYWMLTERIPQMLQALKLPVNEENILWAYNAGVGKVKKNVLPEETRNYIQKYKKGK